MSALNGGVISTFRTAHELWTTDPQELVTAAQEQNYFPSTDALPVVICAKDEAANLPAVLTSLALSDTQVTPIVVVNGSTDASEEVAATMGAIVIAKPQPSKTAAYKAGFSFATSELGADVVLSTDADCVVSTHWAQGMVDSLKTGAEDRTQINFGLIGITHGPSRTTDVMRTFVLNRRQVINRMLGKVPGARGANIGIRVGQTSCARDAILSLRSDTLVGEDRVLRDIVLSTGGAAATNLSTKIVVTKGDRYSSLKEYLDFKRGKITEDDLYQQDRIEAKQLQLQ